MKAYFVDVYGTMTAKVIDIEDDLKRFYNVLDCDTIDIATRTVNGKEFDIVCDDEGLFRDKARWGAITRSRTPALAGNLLFCHHDQEGGLVGLADEDVNLLEDRLVKIRSRGEGLVDYPSVILDND